MITRAEIKYNIWLRLQKSPANPGFYTSDKVDSVIQEALDFLTAESMLADEGFNKKVDYLSPESGAVSLAIPNDMAMICEVRYLYNQFYLPLQYDAQWNEAVWASTSGVQQYPTRYKIQDNMFVFSPAIGVGGTNYLQIEYMAYPPRFRKDTDVMPGQFDRAMFWFLVYKSCNLLAGQVQQTVNDWKTNEGLWYGKALQMINMRTRQSVPVKDFDGY